MTTMFSIARRLVLALLCAAAVADASAQMQSSVSNEGTEFWLTFAQNIGYGGVFRVAVSSREEAVVTVKARSFLNAGLPPFERQIHLLPGQTQTVDLPDDYSTAYGARTWVDNWSIDQDAVHITATRPIAVYGIHMSRFSTDGFLVLPAPVLGHEYVTASYEGNGQQIKVVATENQTTVKVRLRSPGLDEANQAVPAGEERVFSLDQGQVLALPSPSSMKVSQTGSTISADKPIAVFAADRCSNVPVPERACDHLVEMIPPLAALAENYVLAPFKRYRIGDQVRVVAAHDNTVLRRNGLAYPLSKGQFIEFPLDAAEKIETSRPALVMQYMRGYDLMLDGDPSMTLVVPNAQFRNRYLFSTMEAPPQAPKTMADIRMPDNLVSVIIPTGAISTLMLDGLPVDAGAFHPVHGTLYSYASLPVELGSHSIEAAVGFGLYSYGLGYYESYAYPGGMQINNINDPRDPYPPNARTVQAGDVIHGLATDSSDVNANGMHEPDEAIWGVAIGPRNEDGNHNSVLDAGEDLNANGRLDRDLGLARIELDVGATNLTLDVPPFDRGALAAPFTVRRIDPSRDSIGSVVVTDISGNTRRKSVSIVSGLALQNVRIVETVSSQNIKLDLNSFATPPREVRVVANGYEIEWFFPDFSLQNTTDLSYEVDFNSAVKGEQREVSRHTVLEYDDQNGQRVTYRMGPKAVTVMNTAFQLTAALDKSNYTVGEKAALSGTVTNLAINPQGWPHVCVRILDANGVPASYVSARGGTSTGETLSIGTGSTIAAGAQVSISSTPYMFGLDSLHAGAYTAQVMLGGNFGFKGCDPAGAQRTVNLPFTITPEPNAIAVDGGLRLERGHYRSTDRVLAATQVRNVNRHGLAEGYRVRVQVLRPDGSVFGTTERDVPQLVPLNQWDGEFPLALRNEPPGIYTTVLQVVDASGSVVDTRNAPFTILSDADSGFGLRGTLEITPDPAPVGKPLAIHGTVVNRGNAAISDMPVKLRLVDPDTQAVLADYDHNLNLAQGAQEQARLDWAANGVAGKTYWAVLSATVGSGANATEQVLAQEGFQLTAQAVPVITAVDGGGQKVRPGEHFAKPVRVSVRHADGTPVAGVQVEFDVSSVDGAEASFPSGKSATTNAQGMVTRPLKAGARVGSLRVTASSAGASGSAVFDLGIEDNAGGGGGGGGSPGCHEPVSLVFPHRAHVPLGSRVVSVPATLAGMGPNCQVRARVDNGNYRVSRAGSFLAASASAQDFHARPLMLQDGDQITLEAVASHAKDNTITVTVWLDSRPYYWRISTGALEGSTEVKPIPVLGPWATWLLVGLFGLIGGRLARRRLNMQSRNAQ